MNWICLQGIWLKDLPREMGLFCPYNRGSLSIIIEPPVRATPNQKYSSIYVQKRQNGGRNTQKALRVPFLFQLADFAGGGGGEDESFQVVWRTDVEVNYLRQKII